MDIQCVFKGIITACMERMESVQNPKMLGGATPWQEGRENKASQLQTWNFHFLKQQWRLMHRLEQNGIETQWRLLPIRVCLGYGGKHINRSVWENSLSAS